MAKQQRRDAVKASIEKKLRKQLGEGSVASLAETEVRHWFSTGVPPLDVILTGKVGRGLPSGRLVELFGGENVGKTTLGMSMIALAQSSGSLGVLIDTECRFTRKRALRLGVDESSLIRVNEEYLEPILDASISIIEGAKRIPTIMFWDTVAGTPPKAERSGVGHESPMSLHARILSKGMRNIVRPLSESNCLFLVCNQLKAGAVGQPYATKRDQDATLGGKAIRFAADMRVKLEYGRKSFASSTTKKTSVGFEVSAECVKNTNFVQDTKCRLVFLFSKVGKFDPALSSFHTLIFWGKLPKSKGRYLFRGKPYSPEKFKAAYDSDVRFQEHVHDMLEWSYACDYLDEEDPS